MDSIRTTFLEEAKQKVYHNFDILLNDQVYTFDITIAPMGEKQEGYMV